MPRSALILLAVLVPLLGGCFVSTNAFITPASADHPWTDLRARQLTWEGDWKPNGNVNLRREGALYRFEPENSRDVTKFLVKAIGDNTYVAQMQDTSGSGDASYTYALLVVDDKRIYQYAFDDESRECRIPGVDAAALKLKPYEDGCSVPSLAALTQIFATLQKAQPKFETMYEIQP